MDEEDFDDILSSALDDLDDDGNAVQLESKDNGNNDSKDGDDDDRRNEGDEVIAKNDVQNPMSKLGEQDVISSLNLRNTTDSMRPDLDQGLLNEKEMDQNKKGTSSLLPAADDDWNEDDEEEEEEEEGDDNVNQELIDESTSLTENESQVNEAVSNKKNRKKKKRKNKNKSNVQNPDAAESNGSEKDDDTDLDDLMGAVKAAAAAQERSHAETRARQQQESSTTSSSGADDFGGLEKMLQSMLEPLMKEMQDDPAGKQILQTIAQQEGIDNIDELFGSSFGGSSSGQASSASSNSSNTGGGSGAPPASSEEELKQLEDLMKALTSASQEMNPSSQGTQGSSSQGGSSSANGPDLPPESMENFEKLLEQLGGGEDFEKLMESMTQKLFQKDIMYPSIKGLMDLFPSWLAENADKISKEDRTRYDKQIQVLGRILQYYENDEEDFQKLSGFMNDLRDLGNPPSELLEKVNESQPLGSQFPPPGLADAGSTGNDGQMPPMPPGCAQQ